MLLHIFPPAPHTRSGTRCSRWPVRARCPLVRVRSVVDPDRESQEHSSELQKQELPDWVKWQIAEYDRSIADAKQAAQEQRREVEK